MYKIDYKKLHMIIAVIDQEIEYIELLEKHLQGLNEQFEIYPEWQLLNSQGEFPDVIIAPFNMDNLNLFKQLASQYSQQSIPFLFITDEKKNNADMKDLQSSGLVDFISNPISGINLVSRLKLLIKYAKQLGHLTRTQHELESQKKRLEDLSTEQGYLMSIVAHDLKSPLNKVLGLIQLLPMVGDLNDEQQRCITLLNKVVEDGRKLIDDILIINSYEKHVEPLQVVDLDLNTYVETCVNTFQQQGKKKSIQLHFKAFDQINIQTDKESLSRILDNLIDNAIKFSFKNSHVFVHLKKTGAQAHIIVKDEGPGISPEDQKKMFKKFQKLSARPTDGESSTGLGLSIIKVLVDKLNGFIEVDSALGQGTTFNIYLPVSQ